MPGPKLREQPFQWQKGSEEETAIKPEADSDQNKVIRDLTGKNNTTLKTCRNSVQGKTLITDDKGEGFHEFEIQGQVTHHDHAHIFSICLVNMVKDPS